MSLTARSLPFSRAVRLRLVIAAVAIGSLSDGRSYPVAYAQTIDPIVLRARGEIARGRYADAEAVLKPAALSARTGDAALELGLLLNLLGRKSEAEALLVPIVDLDATVGPRTSAAEYARLARAARAMGEFQLANDAYRAASGLSKDPAIQTGWGELFLDAHQNNEAATSFEAALEVDAKWIPALLGFARALREENPPASMELVKKVLSMDPTSVPARLLQAELELDEGKREEAKAAIAEAQSINPFSLEAFALSGAIAYVEDRQQDFERDIAAALKINPRYGVAYRVAGDKAASNYRFEEAAALTRKALELDADEARTHSALGGHLMRTGEEQEARNELERAFKTDPFDTSTYNMLNLLDTLDKFETIREGDFVIRLDPKEAPVMKEYVGPLAARAIAALSKKYQFTVRGPILIEMFPRHDDFAVRTIGLPGFIGALGACFGRVVTLDSPKARPPGEFIWGETLWHELAHVVTLQLSNQRTPRWLSEGVSSYEEKFGSPNWGREGELSFVQAYARDQLMPLRDLNAGFTDPEKISLAYYEASLAVEHIIATHGEAGLRRLLVAYGKGLEGEAAIKEGLGVDFDALQAGFDKMLATKYGAIVKVLAVPKEMKEMMVDPKVMAAGAAPKIDIEAIAAANPESFPVQVALGEFLWKAGRLDDAFKTLERAAQMVPIATGARSPHAMMAQMALQQKNRQRAISELEALLQHARSDLESARLLAKLLEEERDQARLFAAYDRIVSIDPFDAAAHSALGRLALERQNPQLAVREFRATLAAGALDPAVARTDLAESYLALGDKVQARREVLAAIEIAPGYERAQQLLLKLVGSL